MNLLDFKNQLLKLNNIVFELPDGCLVPPHFHVTEVGKITKHFVDCGGVERKEEVVNFQLWNANDYNHRLHPNKLLQIITLAEKQLDLTNASIEVEYQGTTIGKYGVAFKNNHFLLTNTVTDCLAQDACGIPTEKPKAPEAQNNCTPGSGCC